MINGREGYQIDAGDRGLSYGDGLFETLAVSAGSPCLWEEHMQRLEAGCLRLGIPVPEREILRKEVLREIGSAQQGVIKIIVTRGSGGRGYRLPDKVVPTRIVRYTPWPEHPRNAREEGVAVRVCSSRLGLNPTLAGLKTLNRLEQVMARSEWSSPKIAEGLMHDSEGHIIEGTMSNLFLLRGGILVTPDLSRCGIAGVMRRIIIMIAEEMGIRVFREEITLEALMHSDGLFLSNSLIGIWPVREVSGKQFDPKIIPDSLVEQVMSRGFRY